MRTNNLTSTLFAALFCLCFSVSADAQFLKKLGKIASTVGNTANEITKTTQTVQTIQKDIKELTGSEPEADASEPTAEETGAEQPVAVADTPPTASKPSIKAGAPKTEKVPSGQSKQVAINGGSTTMRNMLGSYSMQLLECTGNSSSQTVTITFLVEHSLPNQSLFLYQKDTRAYANGQDFAHTDRFVGTKSGNNMVPTDIPIQCRLVIRNVVPSVQSFDSVLLQMKTQNKDGGRGDQKGTLELRNLAIHWN